MNHEFQSQLFKEFVAEQEKVLLKKGADYSNGQDVLSNFKKSANVLGVTPAQNIISLVQTKVTRLSELVMGDKDPLNETVADNLLDTANYLFLMHCCFVELQIQLAAEESEKLDRSIKDAFYNNATKGLSLKDQLKSAMFDKTPLENPNRIPRKKPGRKPMPPAKRKKVSKRK